VTIEGIRVVLGKYIWQAILSGKCRVKEGSIGNFKMRRVVRTFESNDSRTNGGE
jgi:hypothetical protein